MRSDVRLEEEVEVEENFGPQPISRLEVGALKHLDRACVHVVSLSVPPVP